MATAKQYRIADLLANSVQPFEDLEVEMLASMGQNTIVQPVVITRDGVLIDGHQRLKVLQTKGLEAIPATDVRVVQEATKENALEWSIILNVQGRHLTMEQKRSKALELRQTKRWSDSKIADLFGVSKVAVGQWLKGAPKLDAVIGVDGVVQTQKGKSNSKMVGPESELVMPPGSELIDPWLADGKTLRTIIRLRDYLDKMTDEGATLPAKPSPENLGQDQYDFCLMEIKDLYRALGVLISQLEDPPQPPTRRQPSKRPTKGPQQLPPEAQHEIKEAMARVPTEDEETREIQRELAAEFGATDD